MGILDKSKGDMPGRTFRQIPAGRQHSKPKETPKDTSIFGGKSSLSRGQLRTALGKSSPYIPGAAGRMFGRQERVGLEKSVFGKKYGSQIGTKDYSKAIKGLEKSKYKARTQSERLEIERKTKFLKGLGGK